MSQSKDIDTAKLRKYLEAKLETFSGPISLKKFSGGQSNPTFLVESSSGKYVLRKQPAGVLQKSAHAVDREFRVLQALSDSEVPVASVLHLCEDPDLIGGQFYLMDYCEGNIHWDAGIQEASSNEIRAEMYDEMNRVLAAIHNLDHESVGLGDFGKAGNYFERQLGRWSKQYRSIEDTYIPQMHELMIWLSNNLPHDDGRVSLTHGDYRIDNLIFSKDNRSIRAVLDWELSTLGHPLSDLAYQCMCMRLPEINPGTSLSGLEGVNTRALGIPSEEEYVEKYCERTGINGIANWSFYLAFSFFRLAAICRGVAKRAENGNASNQNASKVGGMVIPLAQRALNIIDSN